jgi:hypothetical protein
MMNDELKAACSHFIVHRSYFIVSSVFSVPSAANFPSARAAEF